MTITPLWLRTSLCGLALLLILVLTGCVQMSGQVLAVGSETPVPEAQFFIGRPGGLASTPHARADSKGMFDFSVMTTDQGNVYVWDGTGDPGLTARRVDPRLMGTDMKVYVYTGGGGSEW
jgi:hypothetical protein